jgi:esterase
MILHKTEMGDGAPVILLRGLFGAGRNLGQIMRPLAEGRRIIALDLRNHGESPRGRPMDYPTMAGDVAQTMAALDIDRAAVIGHSMGGKTAMALALSQPALVERLGVLDIAPVAYRHEGYDAYLAAMQAVPLSADLSRAAADEILARAVPEPSLRAFLLHSLVLRPEPHWRLGLAEIEASLPDLLDWADPPGATPYRAPTLFLHGGTSSYVKPVARAEIEKRFPAATIETIDGAGHWMHAEKPQAVAEALIRFLDERG